MEQSTEQLYPTELIDLPSKGLFYPEGSPLRSGQIELKYMTAKEEDILTSTNLIQKGIVIDKLIDALIVTKGIKSSDLLVGDLNAVMVASRILGYGKDYDVKLKCPSCNSSVEQTVDLTTLNIENEPDDDMGNEFTIILPISNVEITLKLMTRGDELEVEKEIRALKKANGQNDSESTSRLRAMIKAVNGDTSRSTIWKFVEGLLVKDARYIRDQYKISVPNVNFDIEVECDCTESIKTARLPIGANFFWPDA